MVSFYVAYTQYSTEYRIWAKRMARIRAELEIKIFHVITRMKTVYILRTTGVYSD